MQLHVLLVVVIVITVSTDVTVCFSLLFSFQMASCSDRGFTEEAGSPLPRAPPPSPECPTRNLDLNQFDFNSLLSGKTRKQPLSFLPPSSSGLMASPESTGPESLPTSPSWNESGSFQAHSPFFLPSPEHQVCKALSGPPSPLSISVPERYQHQPQGRVVDHTHQSYACNGGTLSVSLPVNGDLQHYHTLENHPLHVEPGHRGNGHHGDEGKRRKISLKRSHEQVDQPWYSAGLSSEHSLYSTHSHEATQKKMCSDVRERESRDFNNRSPSPHRTRAYTHSGVMTMSRQHLSTEFNRMTISKDSSNSFGLLDGHAPPPPPPPRYSPSHIGSHVIPQSLQTVGFVTVDSAHLNVTDTSTHDESMEMDVGGSSFPVSHGGAFTRISITRADSVEHSSMETNPSLHAPAFSLPTQKSSQFSFSLAPSNFNPCALHPHSGVGGAMGGVFNQEASGFRSSSEVLSHSL